MGLLPDRHLPLLHHLEQRRLHLRWCAVDLVREEEVAEDGPELGVESVLRRAVHPRPDEVGGHEIRCELDALEASAEHVGNRLDRQRLREPGDAFDQQVPTGEQADEDPLQHLVLPRDHALDLEHGALDDVAIGAGSDGLQMGLVGHGSTPRSVCDSLVDEEWQRLL